MSSEWPKVILKNVTSILGDGLHGTPEYDDQGGYFFINGNNLCNGRIVFNSNTRRVSTSEYEKHKKNLNDRTILVSINGTLGNVALYRGEKVILGKSACYFNVVADVDKEFVRYVMDSTYFQSYIHNLATGSTIKNVSLKLMRDFSFHLPPIATQKAISSVLTALDDRITLLRETNATLEAIAQAMFKSWFVDFEPIHAKQQGRAPEGVDEDTAALFPDSFEESELGLVPSGWQTSAVYDLALYINGAAYKAFNPNSELRGLPIIKIAELKAGITKQTGYSDISMPEKYKINAGDILFSWSGNPDTSIDTFVWLHGNAWLNQHIFRIIPNTSSERSFVLMTLKYLNPIFAEIARNKQTTGLGHVTIADLKRLRVVKPNTLILKQWNEIVDPLIERAFNVMQQAQNLTTLRDMLLPRLISGQLKLRDIEVLFENT